MRKHLWILAACVFIMSAQTVALRAQNFDGTAPTIGSDVATPNFNNVDGGPGYARDSSGNLWFLYSNGSSVWQVWKGTTADNLVLQYSFNTVGVFPTPNTDDRYWAIGLWIDPSTGYWYTTVHVEYDYNGGPNGLVGDHLRRIDMAMSTNQGQTWSYENSIVTTPSVYPSTISWPYTGNFYFGDGDQKLYIDKAHGYFYIFYMTTTVDGATGAKGPEYIMAARSLISQKMAPNSWYKWWGGGWTQAGLGGDETPITSTACDSFTVCWNTYLQSYMAVVNDYAGSIYTSPDLNAENWTKLGQFATNGGTAPYIEWYNWPVDESNLADSMTVGQSFRVYSAENNAGKATKYLTLTLNAGYAAPFNLSPWYQIVDRNSGMALAVTGASTSSGADIVQETSNTSAPAQQWQIQSLGTGYYTVVNKNSGLVAGVPGNLWDGGAVTQWPYTSSELDQEWSMEPSETSGGTQYYKLQEDSDSRVMGIGSGSLTAGASAIGWDDIFGATDQEFSLVPMTVPNGAYLLTAHNSGLTLDDAGYGGSGTDLDQWAPNGGTNQEWTVANNGQGYFTLTCTTNGLAAGVNNSTTAGQSLILEPVTGAADQLWTIQPFDGSYYRLINKLSGDAMDVDGGSTTNGADIDQWNVTGGWNQEWSFTAL